MPQTISLDDFSMQPHVYCGNVAQSGDLKIYSDWQKLTVQDEHNTDSKPIILVATFEEASQAIDSQISRDVDLSKYSKNLEKLRTETINEMRNIKPHEVVTLKVGHHEVHAYCTLS